jgi:hypothetical protein
VKLAPTLSSGPRNVQLSALGTTDNNSCPEVGGGPDETAPPATLSGLGDDAVSATLLVMAGGLEGDGVRPKPPSAWAGFDGDRVPMTIPTITATTATTAPTPVQIFALRLNRFGGGTGQADLHRKDWQPQRLRVLQLGLARLGVDRTLRQREDEHVAATNLFEDRAPPCFAAGETLVHPHLLVSVLQILRETFDRVPVPAGVADKHRHG